MSLLVLFAIFCVNVAFGKECPHLSKDCLDFSNWDQVVKQLVKANETLEGIQLHTFDYPKLVNNTHYEKFTQQVETAIVTGFTKAQYYAFWINVYNYLAVRAVFEHPCAVDVIGDCRPLRSIQEIGTQQPSLVAAVWDLPLLTIKSMNKTLSLNNIEDGLRSPPKPWKEDPRLHAAIVCASISCPNLRNRAYTVENIDSELTSNTQDFLANPKKGCAIEGDALRISAIFSFFPDDFNNKTGKVGNTTSISISWFLSQYAPTEVKKFLAKNPDPNFLYFKYNWHLNGDISKLCSADRVCFPWWAFLVIAIAFVCLVLLFVIYYKKSKKRNYERLN